MLAYSDAELDAINKCKFIEGKNVDLVVEVENLSSGVIVKIEDQEK
jgi:hypothetical protein